MIKKIIKKILPNPILSFYIKTKYPKKPSEELPKFFDVGFHGDKYLIEFVFHCISKCRQFIETGTSVGTSFIYILNNFPQIDAYSCEADEKNYAYVKEKSSQFKNAKIFKQKSPKMLYDITKKDKNILQKDTVFWLDAHGNGYRWPLREEIKFITNNFKSGYIFIDDFKVPGLDYFNYDKYEEQICSFDYIKDSIKSNLEYNLYYPSYSDKTSNYNPLVGWGLIEFGHGSKLELPENIKRKVTKKNIK